MGLQEFIEKLPLAGAAPPYRVLAELSSISDQDAERLAAIWAGWRPAVLRQFLRRLAMLAEENVLYEFDAVFKAALTAPDAVARAISVGGLHESSDKSVARRLARLLTEDTAEEVRVAAAMGLIRFAAMACEGRMIPRDYDRIREALKAAIEKPDETREVRRRAIEAIGHYPADVNEGYIVEAYQSGERLLKQSALFAMGRSGSRRWVPEITTSLSSENPDIRYEAVTALGMIGEEVDAALLVGVLEDDDLQVRASALMALGRLGGASARRIIQRELHNRIPAIAEAAREAMEELGLGEPMLADQPGIMGIKPEANVDGNGHAR
ncbi:MAG: HEAT repeat domain-containing protein [Chloroflexi bacterium]|nr:HEAT repeat domain-containing protein [Chloroflexota bacterium]